MAAKSRRRAPQKPPLHRFVGHQNPANGTARIHGSWGSLERGGAAGPIPVSEVQRLEALGYLFEREEVKD